MVKFMFVDEHGKQIVTEKDDFSFIKEDIPKITKIVKEILLSNKNMSKMIEFIYNHSENPDAVLLQKNLRKWIEKDFFGKDWYEGLNKIFETSNESKTDVPESKIDSLAPKRVAPNEEKKRDNLVKSEEINLHDCSWFSHIFLGYDSTVLKVAKMGRKECPLPSCGVVRNWDGIEYNKYFEKVCPSCGKVAFKLDKDKAIWSPVSPASGIFDAFFSKEEEG